MKRDYTHIPNHRPVEPKPVNPVDYKGGECIGIPFEGGVAINGYRYSLDCRFFGNKCVCIKNNFR